MSPTELFTQFALGALALAGVAATAAGCRDERMPTGSPASTTAADPPPAASERPAATSPPRPEASPLPGRCVAIGRPLQWGYSPTATPLLDGTILVAGGRHHDGYEYLRETQIFDPRTRRFTPGPPMSEERAMHTAIGLPDGNVLVAGGMAEPLELFDAKLQRWSVVGRLAQAMRAVALALRPDGRVLIVGGDLMWKGAMSAEVLAWDPKTGRATKVAELPTGLSGVAVSRADGTLLLSGVESGEFGEPRRRQLLLDPAARYATRPVPPDDPWASALRALPEGEPAELVVGRDGRAVGGPHVTMAKGIHRYVAARGAWELVVPFAHELTAHASALVDERTLLVVGGLEPTDEAEICRLP